MRSYPDKGACALKWGAPLSGVIGYAHTHTPTFAILCTLGFLWGGGGVIGSIKHTIIVQIRATRTEYRIQEHFNEMIEFHDRMGSLNTGLPNKS